MNTDKHDHESEILMHDQEDHDTINQYLLRLLFEQPATIAFFILVIVFLSVLGNMFASSLVSKILNTILLLAVAFSIALLVLTRKSIRSNRNNIDLLTRIELMTQMIESQAQIMKLLYEKMHASFKVSLSHPKLLSKRHSTHFRVRIYPGAMRHIVTLHLNKEKSKKDILEQEFSSTITSGEIVEVKLFSPVIDFSPPVTKKIVPDINLCSFTGIPKDDCSPDTHAAILTITQKETGFEILNIPFDLQIVDFVFDHLSRPLLSNVVTVILGASSLATYILTLLGKIDTVFGVTSGTTAGAIAAILQIRVFSLYKNMSKTIQHP